MCDTGGFALALMADPSVMAPMLSQPSPPLPITAAHRSALGVSPEGLASAKTRCQEGITILGLRFTGDRLCPPERFATLREEFRTGFEGIEIDSSPGNPFHIPPDVHSVVTSSLVDGPGHPTHEALERVLTMFQRRLLDPP